MDQIFGDSDVQRIFEFAGQGTAAPKLDDLDGLDRQRFIQFVHADQDPGKPAAPAGLIAAFATGISTCKQLSDLISQSWTDG